MLSKCQVKILICYKEAWFTTDEAGIKTLFGYKTPEEYETHYSKRRVQSLEVCLST